MHRSGPEYPAQVTSVEELTQQLYAELVNVRLPALNDALRAAFADTDKDHPSQIVFDALKYNLMQIITRINAAITREHIKQCFDDLHDNFVEKYLQSHIAFDLSEIKKNEALAKKVIKLTGIKHIDELTGEILYASLTEYKRNLFDKIVEVYHSLAQQCFVLQQALVREDEFKDQMTEITEAFHRDVRGISSKIVPYRRSQIRVGIHEPNKFDLLEDRLAKIEGEVRADSYLEQVHAEINADANQFTHAVNQLKQSQSDLSRRAETLRGMFRGIEALSAEADASAEDIRRHIDRYDVLAKALHDDVAAQQKQFSRAKEELLKKGRAAYKSFQELDFSNLELPKIHHQAINQQQLIIDIDQMIAELQRMQKDDSEFKQKVFAQTSVNHTLFKNIPSIIGERLTQARATYLALEPVFQKEASDLAEACLAQTYTLYKNPLWVSASACVKEQLSGANGSQYHQVLLNDTRRLARFVEVSAANVVNALDHRFIDNTTEVLLRIHRQYDAAIGELQELRGEVVQKISRHLVDKARAALPAMKQEAIQQYELSLNALKELKPVSAAELNVPNSDALRKRFSEPAKPKARRASFSTMREKFGMDAQPDAHHAPVQAQSQPNEKPGFFKRHPWVKAALIGLGVGLLITGIVVGVAGITVATMGAGAPPAIAGVVAVGAIVGAKLGLVAGSAAATGVGFAVVAGSAGVAGALAGCATKAVIDCCKKPSDPQNVVVAPVANPEQLQPGAARVAEPDRGSRIHLPSVPVVVPRGREKNLDRTMTHSFSGMQPVKSSRALLRSRERVSQIGFFAFNALPMPEQVLIEKFEIALAKAIYLINWGESYAAKFQARVTNKNSATKVIEQNLEGERTREVVIRAVQNTINSQPDFKAEFGNLGEFTGNSMEDLEAYLHRAYQSQHALAF